MAQQSPQGPPLSCVPFFVQELGLIPTPKTAAATAAFLKGTLLLDKSMLGEYLSRGPADKYPFNAQVRVEQ